MTLLPTIFSSPYRMLDDRTEKDDAARRGAELVTPDGRRLPLVASRLRAEAGGGLARFVLEQTFENAHDEPLRVTYKLPLPADGAVSGYEFQIGLRTIEGKVDPKHAARERFEQAIAEGKTAAILEQARADVFTQEIGNIAPRASLVARITVDAPLAWLPEGAWELRFPTVIGPRYDAPREVAVTVSPTDTGARAHFELFVRDAIVAGGAPTSPSHAIRVRDDGAVELAANEGARLDRDVVVRWPVAEREVGVSVATARKNDRAYGLVTVVPPSPDARAAFVPRDLVVLVDTSGSMSGKPLDQAKRVVGLLVDALGPEDRLELIAFSTGPTRWKSAPVAATREEKREAHAWLKKLDAGGGTDMYTGVVEALRALRDGAQRQVVLVTDGYIGGEQDIVELLHARMPASCRFHVVGVGSAVNRTLAASLARAGRGAEILVGLDEDAERAAKRLLDRTGAPVLTDVTIGGEAVLEHAPEHLPDVFAGAPLVAAVSLRPEGGELVVRGKLARGTWEKRVRVAPVARSDDGAAIPALFARERVADLEMRWTIGRDAAAIDRSIERLGVEFQIATRLTSWVAVDDAKSVDPSGRSRHEVMPQELPYGTSMASFGLAPPFQIAMAGPAGYGAPPAPAMAMRAMSAMPLAGAAPKASLPSPRRRRRPLVALVAALLVFLLAALVVWLLSR